MKRALIAGLTLLAAACGSAPQTSRDLDRIAAEYQRQAAADQQQRHSQQDTCGMAQSASLIGLMQSEVRAPENARVICFGCTATLDHVPTRLTIQIGADRKVASMRCG